MRQRLHHWRLLWQFSEDVSQVGIEFQAAGLGGHESARMLPKPLVGVYSAGMANTTIKARVVATAAKCVQRRQ